MTPIGPFRSPWCDLSHFIVQTVIGSDIVTCVVPNGVQARDGIQFLSVRDARAHLADNGFELASKCVVQR